MGEEMRLFEAKPKAKPGPREKEANVTEAKQGNPTELTETLAGIERRRVRVMEELAEVAVEQKALQKEMRAAEREMKEVLKNTEGYSVPEDHELTLEDVESWMRQEFNIMAHTAPANPHTYFSRKKSRDPGMYERVVAYVLENGYEQKYGGDPYTVLDVRLNDGVWFAWAMTTEPSESEVLNLKPDSMRPEEA